MKKVMLVLMLLPILAPALRAQDSTGMPPYERARSRLGERCLVCNGVLDTSSGFVLLVRGRRVPLDPIHLGDFMKNQDGYFARLQPRGALFAETFDAAEGTVHGGVSWGWFAFGAYVLVAIVFAGLSGYVAVGKGLKPVPSFFMGLAFSAIGFVRVLRRQPVAPRGSIPAGLVKVPTTSAPIECGKCGAGNHPSARRCAKCGTSLTPQMESEVARVQ